jgi:hypothetical protein
MSWPAGEKRVSFFGLLVYFATISMTGPKIGRIHSSSPTTVTRLNFSHPGIGAGGP